MVAMVSVSSPAPTPHEANPGRWALTWASIVVSTPATAPGSVSAGTRPAARLSSTSDRRARKTPLSSRIRSSRKRSSPSPVARSTTRNSASLSRKKAMNPSASPRAASAPSQSGSVTSARSRCPSASTIASVRASTAVFTSGKYW